jgi:hypothetical protein
MSSQNQYVPEFSTQPNRFTLHNSTPEELTLRWAGLQYSIPPVDQVNPKHSAKDADGDFIPGTFVVTDSYAPREDGSYPKGGSFNWFAADAIKHSLGINPDTGVAEGSYAAKGVSFLPKAPTKEQVANIARAGKERYDFFLVEWAQNEVAAQQQAMDRASRAGVPVPPPGKDYGRALTILTKYQKTVDSQVGAVTDGLEEVAAEEDLRFKVWAMAEAVKLAGAAAEAKQVDKNVLAENLLTDPEVQKHLRRQYRIRRIGHLPEEELTEAGA